MKNVRRFLLSFCVVAMLVSCLGAFAFAEEPDYVTYTIKGGDTVFNVCKSLKIDFYANQDWIKEVNSIGNFNNIKVGKVLYLPNFDTVKDPTRANNVKKTVKDLIAAAAKTAVVAATPAPVGSTTNGDSVVSYLINHKLKEGETVGSVCAKYGIDFEANAAKIKTLSGIANYYHVPVGQVVVIPSLTIPEGGSYTAIVAHVVKGGETAGSICGLYGLQFAKVQGQLKALNNTENLNRINVGQTFYLPVPSSSNQITSGVATTPAAPSTTTPVAATAAVAGLTYKASKQTSAHGSFRLEVNGVEAGAIAPGVNVKIVAAPDAGYKVYTVTVLKAGTDQALPVGNMNFTMPAFDVTVNVTFKTAG